MWMRESEFQASLIRRIRDVFGDRCMVLKNDPNYRQGVPDLLILFDDGRWAALECKRYANASYRPNQAYYVDLLSQWSFAAFVYPENQEEIINALQRTFQA